MTRAPQWLRRGLPLVVLACALFVCALGAGACKDSTTAPGNDIVFPDRDVSYAAHVQPFLTLRCANYGCHDVQTRRGNLSLAAYEDVTARAGMVVRGNADASVLIQTLEARLPHPPSAPIIATQNQIAGMRRWVQEGAKNN